MRGKRRKGKGEGEGVRVKGGRGEGEGGGGHVVRYGVALHCVGASGCFEPTGTGRGAVVEGSRT